MAFLRDWQSARRRAAGAAAGRGYPEKAVGGTGPVHTIDAGRGDLEKK